MLKKMGCIVLVLAFLFISASADKQNTHSYTVYNTPMDWYSAKEFCEQQGGHLVTITSEEEQDTVAEILRSHGTMEVYWIGMFDNDSLDGWQWITGEPIEYTNWLSEVPNGRTELMGEIYAGKPDKIDYKWSGNGSWWGDFEAIGDTLHLPHGFICEWDVTTSSSNDEDTRSNDADSNMRMMDAAHSTQDTEFQLSIGDYVNFGNDFTWQVVNLENDIATLFYGGCFQGVFDASIHMETHTINLMRYHSYGSATWEYSDVRQWLNSRETTDTGLDVAFDYGNLAQGISGMGMSAIIKAESGSYAYTNKPGFLNSANFSDLEYWLLEPNENISIVPYTQIPGDVVSASSFENFQADMSALYTDNVGQTSTVDRIYLLNAREIKEYLINNNLSPFAFTNGNSYPAYWLRDSVYSDLAGYYFYYGTEMLTVSNYGASSQQADLSAYIRPACNINLNYINSLHGSGTADDPYTFEIDPTVINRPMPEITTAEEAITPSATIADPTEESASNASSSDVPVVQVNRYFEAAFAHAANKIDKALCLQSAYASKKVYNETKIVDLLVDLGFDASTIEQQDYSSGATHSVGITMANRIVKDESGEPITLYALIVRGTEGTMEWISDFDIGEGNVALGFDKAASRAMRHFAQYVKNNPPLKGGFSDGNYKVWTCGHSRGAAVANLLAGKYLSQYLSADNVYAYGFAVPYVDKKATRCSNIFNFNIAGDLIPNVPFNAWSFERYGLTIYNTSNDIHGVAVNTEANIRLMVGFLLDSVPTQKEYVSRTKEFLQIIEDNPASQEVDLEFMIKGLLSTCTTAGTIPELLVKLDANEDLEFLANLIDPGSLPDGFVYTTEDFITTLNHIGTSHSMDTYLLWIEDICASEN